MYADVTFADEYINTKLNNNAWLELDEITKEKYLAEATRRINSIIGIKIPKETPDDVKTACSEIAFTLLEFGADNVHLINQSLGITSISFGNDTVSYKDTNGSKEAKIIDDYAMSILNKYIKKGFDFV